MRPPRPAVDPDPKAHAERERHAAYEDEAHPETQRFWQNIPEDHPYRGHPVLTPHGTALSREALDFTNQKLQGVDKANGMGVFRQIMQIEGQHAAELVALAQKVTQQIWGLPPTEKVEGELGTPEVSTEEEEEPQPKPAEEEIGVPLAQVRDQVHKRVTLNAMTQGAAVHVMMSAHHLVSEELNRISPQLLRLYGQLAGVSVRMYWDMDIPAMANQVQALMGSKVGECKISFPKAKKPQAETINEDTPADKPWKKPLALPAAAPEEPSVKMRAAGMCFPVLVQEMSKAVMETASMWGVAGIPKNELKTIYRHADRMVDEPWLIQVGPALWRKFLAVVQGMPKKESLSLIHWATVLARTNPQSLHTTLEKVVSDPPYAAKMLSMLRGQQAKEGFVPAVNQNEDQET